jgi:hypothetical protein
LQWVPTSTPDHGPPDPKHDSQPQNPNQSAHLDLIPTTPKNSVFDQETPLTVQNMDLEAPDSVHDWNHSDQEDLEQAHSPEDPKPHQNTFLSTPDQTTQKLYVPKTPPQTPELASKANIQHQYQAAKEQSDKPPNAHTLSLGIQA